MGAVDLTYIVSERVKIHEDEIGQRLLVVIYLLCMVV